MLEEVEWGPHPNRRINPGPESEEPLHVGSRAGRAEHLERRVLGCAWHAEIVRLAA
jgi:hypothetical protein